MVLNCGPPFGAGQQIDEEFRVVETAGIAAIIRTSDLADDLRHFGKAGEHERACVGERNARRRAGAGGQSSADPDRAFIEVREELRADDSAEAQEQHERQRGNTHAESEFQMVESTSQAARVAILEKVEAPGSAIP